MTRPRAALSALAVAISLAVAPASAAPPVARSACTQARIEGQSRCIARGQFCRRSARAMRDYRRHGYSCTKRDGHGRYHLQ
jgi:hypothetical protein